MKTRTLGFLGAVALAFNWALGVPAGAQEHRMPSEQAKGGMGHEPDHMADMRLFHELIAHRDTITRQITLRPDGVDTITESSDPSVALTLQAHVASMTARVKEARPIHERDPLFREVFKHADQIAMRHESTPKGIRVIETSSDPYVAKLIQAHAAVVSGFLANGMAEMMKDHEVPPR
jgi:hypothetical protein